MAIESDNEKRVTNRIAYTSYNLQIKVGQSLMSRKPTQLNKRNLAPYSKKCRVVYSGQFMDDWRVPELAVALNRLVQIWV